jgi:hypothetical protein
MQICAFFNIGDYEWCFKNYTLTNIIAKKNSVNVMLFNFGFKKSTQTQFDSYKVNKSYKHQSHKTEQNFSLVNTFTLDYLIALVSNIMCLGLMDQAIASSLGAFLHYVYYSVNVKLYVFMNKE